MQLPVWPSFDTTAVRRGLNQFLRLWENTAFTCVGRRCVLGNSLSGNKGDSTVSGSHGRGRLFGLYKPNPESRRANSNRFTAHYEWLALDLPLVTTYQYVAYLNRNRDHRSIVHPTAYLPVPVWLQYRCSTLSNRTDLAE